MQITTLNLGQRYFIIQYWKRSSSKTI